nr:hypothetical protein [Pandoravirus massiliensis]
MLRCAPRCVGRARPSSKHRPTAAAPSTKMFAGSPSISLVSLPRSSFVPPFTDFFKKTLGQECGGRDKRGVCAKDRKKTRPPPTGTRGRDGKGGRLAEEDEAISVMAHAKKATKERSHVCAHACTRTWARSADHACWAVARLFASLLGKATRARLFLARAHLLSPFLCSLLS